MEMETCLFKAMQKTSSTCQKAKKNVVIPTAALMYWALSHSLVPTEIWEPALCSLSYRVFHIYVYTHMQLHTNTYAHKHKHTYKHSGIYVVLCNYVSLLAPQLIH